MNSQQRMERATFALVLVTWVSKPDAINLNGSFAAHRNPFLSLLA